VEAIVLAGGLGTRLRGIVSDRPKAMALVAGKPFLEIMLQSLARKGFSRVVLSLGYMAEAITTHFGAEFAGLDLVHAIEPYPLGTGGAAKLAMTRVLGDHAYIFNGDTYLDLEVAAVEKQWQRNRLPLIVTRHVADTTRYGRVLVQGDRVTGFLEKGKSGPGLINAGAYVFAPHHLDDYGCGSPFSLETDFLGTAVTSQEVGSFITHGIFIDIGIPHDYSLAQTLLAPHA
jgi:D-glycero-alpha-D-manno-heptose 1-phosphate guanylyltransferase